MPRQLSLSALIELPEDHFVAAEVTAAIKEPWLELLQQLKDRAVKFTHAEDITETRATTGARRGRKPRLVAVDPKTTEAA